MTETVGPPNIAAAALVMQFFLSVIISVCAWLVRHENRTFRFYRDARSTGRYPWIVLGFALGTIGLLIFSDQFSNFWHPLLDGTTFLGLTFAKALLWVFLLDIAFVAVLVYLTGGSYQSPFTPIYFILPAMAFFLRELPYRVILYSALIVLLFIVGLSGQERNSDDYVMPIEAYAITSVACLILSVAIGFLTRPH
jgi:hypothetical protein